MAEKTFVEVKTALAEKYERAALRSKSKTRSEKWVNKAKKYRFQATVAGRVIAARSRAATA